MDSINLSVTRRFNKKYIENNIYLYFFYFAKVYWKNKIYHSVTAHMLNLNM